MYKQVVFPLLSRFDEERVHEATLRLAYYGRIPWVRKVIGKLLNPTDPRLRIDVPELGLNFRGPLGIAAGFDKFGMLPNAVASLGFSHIEEGTVTPIGQDGNPKKRVFRLKEDHALINRMGFNGPGVITVAQRLSRQRPDDFMVGGSVGANKLSVESGQWLMDYVVTAKQLAPFVDYIAANISSPNTQGLRQIQEKEAVTILVEEMCKVRDNFFPNLSILFKVSTDLTREKLSVILDVLFGKRRVGIIYGNTTLERPSTLRSRYAQEVGGLSGPMLRKKTAEFIPYIYRETDGKLPIFGVGGIENWHDTLVNFANGVVQNQSFTGLVYGGPLFPWVVNRGISKYLTREGIPSLQSFIGSAVR